MRLTFYKYQGTGNDFILLDNRARSISLSTAQIQQLCDRKFGIGADGLMLIEPHQQFDFEMIYHNADGSKSLCGNGSRCAIHFANYLGMIGNETTFITTDGPHRGEIRDGLVSFQLRDIQDIYHQNDHTFIDNGSPHHIEFVDNVQHFDVKGKGSGIRNAEHYQPDGTNVNFVEITGKDSLYVRTFERGVEDETLSCGTGVTASAIAAYNRLKREEIKVKTLGGELRVKFREGENGFQDIFLIGPATMVFKGEIEI